MNHMDFKLFENLF